MLRLVETESAESRFSVLHLGPILPGGVLICPLLTSPFSNASNLIEIRGIESTEFHSLPAFYTTSTEYIVYDIFTRGFMRSFSINSRRE